MKIDFALTRNPSRYPPLHMFGHLVMIPPLIGPLCKLVLRTILQQFLDAGDTYSPTGNFYNGQIRRIDLSGPHMLVEYQNHGVRIFESKAIDFLHHCVDVMTNPNASLTMIAGTEEAMLLWLDDHNPTGLAKYWAQVEQLKQGGTG